MRSLRALFLPVLVALLLLDPTAATATHEETGTYELPAIAQWKDASLNVLIVPPNHGQIINGEGGLLGGMDPNELTLNNSYVEAIESAIDAWEKAVHQMGSDELRDAYDVRRYLLGRDTVPPEVLTQPDILVVTDESQGGSLGTAIRVMPCIVRMSKMALLSFSPADMFNVTAQEFGHCLGLRHVGSQGGVDPLSPQMHPEHDVMNGFYNHFIGDAGTHRHCVSNLDIVALEFALGEPNRGLLPTAGASATMFVPADVYGSTCEPPPPWWRDRVPPPVRNGPPPPPEPEPEPRSEITSPADGAKLKRKALKQVAGKAETQSSAPVDVVYVALTRMDGEGRCSWWDAETSSLSDGDCGEPIWNPAQGTDEWLLPIDVKLPAGRYNAMSEAASGEHVEPCCLYGYNDIDFRLR